MSERVSVRIRHPFLATTAGVVCLVVLLFAGRALVVAAPLASPDVIISLSGHEWERLPSTAIQARQNPRALVLLTQPRAVSRYNCNDCGHRIDRLVNEGVEASRIRMLAVDADGTYWEAVGCRQFLLENGSRRLLIVTSPYHTRRAFAAFRKVLAGTGIAIGVAPAFANSGARPGLWWTRYGDLRYVAYEWVALLSYIPRYGVIAVPPFEDPS
jgi:uncharacterized SAM-binding protein YcdF (DUF218 family)